MKNKGITLISLVVTIIVLLILAGVALNLTIGENGIFRRAEDTAKIYSQSAVLEEAKMAISDKYIDYAMDNQGCLSFVSYLSEKCVNDNAIVTNSGKIITVDSSTGKIFIDGTNEYNMYAKEDGDVIIGATEDGSTEEKRLVWSDEFNGNELDLSTWSYRDTPSSSNEEEKWVDTNAKVNDGTLKITAKYDSKNGYTSSEIWTLGKKTINLSTPGRIEASIALPQASSKSGAWPAFWMLGTAPFSDKDSGPLPICGEIDIMEAINSLDTLYATVHGLKKSYYRESSFDISNLNSENIFDYLEETGLIEEYNKLQTGELQLDDTLTSKGWNTELINGTEFHVYAVEWSKDDNTGHTILHFYFDDKNYFNLDLEDTYGEFAKFFVSPHYNFYAILDLAVGGDWPGEPTSSEYPLTMEVDYVRYYKMN